MKLYTGTSNPQECEFSVIVRGDLVPSHELNPRLDLRNHSPTGVSWGYAGSGPAQCALAILADCCGDEVALKYYQHFKRQVISQLEPNWRMTDTDINNWLKEREQ